MLKRTLKRGFNSTLNHSGVNVRKQEPPEARKALGFQERYNLVIPEREFNDRK